MNESALICDMAQYYHIYDYRKLEAGYAAILACGLPAESRIMCQLSKYKCDLQSMLLASIADRVATLVWFQTKDGRKHRNRPKSYVDMLLGKKENRENKSFKSGKEFEAERKRLLRNKK